MPLRLALGVILLALYGCATPSDDPAAVTPARAEATPLDVMSFNIRYGTANDGDDHWRHRRAHVIDVMRTSGAHLIGLQEALRFQLDELAEALPDYEEIGVGRDDGHTRGEYAALLYRRDRFEVVESGTFWFSDTPDVVASASWGNRIPRICTWARLRDRTGGPVIRVFNVHLDHRSAPSRERSVALLRERLATGDRTEPVIVTGDFNAGETSAEIRGMTAPPDGLVDAFRVVHPEAQAVGTFTGFGETPGREKIDYVFVSTDWNVLDASINRDRPDGRWPSDHLPVTARVTRPPAATR